MIVKAYASYGVLGHEKRPVYTVDRPASDIYEETELYIPNKYQLGTNEAGQTLIDIDSSTYLLNDVLSGRDDRPVLSWTTDQGSHWMYVDSCKMLRR